MFGHNSYYRIRRIKAQHDIIF